MRFTYVDYEGPGSDHAVIDGRAVPCDERATRRLAENAALLSLGDPKRAAHIETPQQYLEREFQISAV
jgi:hypothetical protein